MRFNIGKKAPPDNGPVFHTVKVGSRHPYLVPPPHGGQAIGLATGQLDINMFYTLPIDWEVASLAGTCVACGLHLTQDCLVPIFIFQGKTGQWPIHAPVIASPKEVEDWIGYDTNLATFTLMEAETGIVRRIRHLGLDENFMAMMKAALPYVPHPGSASVYADLLEEVGPQGLWEGAKKWLWNERAEAFEPL